MPSSRRLTVLGLALLVAGAALAQNVPLDALMRGGRIHYSGGRYERARDQFTDALDKFGATVDGPTLADIHIWLGLSKAQLRDFGPAAGHFTTALAADPATADRLRADEQWEYWSWTALVNTARDFYNNAAYDSSLHYALAALKVNPGKSGAYSLVANSYSALERYEEMIETAREMLRLQDNSPEAFSLIGLYYLQKPDSLWTGEMKAARWDSCSFYYGEAIRIYEERFDKTRQQLADLLRINDEERLDRVVFDLVEKSRSLNQEILKKYIEQDLGARSQLAEVAQLSQQLFYAANNLNISSSRAGSAMLRAASETQGENSEKFRARSEQLFVTALEYDPFDFTALFNLGIARYQSQDDTLAEHTFAGVVEGTVAPLAELPEDWQARLLALITPDVVGDGHVQFDPATMASVDSLLALQGRMSGGFGWLYFPDLRDRKDFTAAGPDDASGVFLSIQSPPALENVYLLLGVTQTSIGLSREAAAKGSGREKLEQAIATLKTVTRLNPSSAEAWQNLGHCYRETGQSDRSVEAFRKYQQLTGGK
ncbi:tetratricopeptide repeat protein [candidate division WOR-3 bacterium]|nr:tetratricopeptide repeat protein [candidate division WOR-3 bacterium]